ncbi:Dihydrofolate reductase [Liberibacter crescens BT-1]|uniref:Dihydrofolate reductase n=1 Tax=Liberibacter crescens (strain BT-1) TaxID=1215343 RepID=L0EUI9_LIBCB|nr:dihydrofolate reductase [Liberibacter crescens]AGA64627.1 Dihydrofolate reductase [Liberibacter crescens BT-1]AMC12741.1 diacylglycerol kinase [Liberibacter crescens]
MNNFPEIIIIAAVARNGVIGQKGKIPWRLSTDMKRFKSLTIGKPIIMGHKTLQSIGKPLPERHNIIVTRNQSLILKDIEIAFSIKDALDIAFKKDTDKIFIIGGGQIYAQVIDIATVLQITYIDSDIQGDVFFPPINPHCWQKIEELFFPVGKDDSYPTRFTTYKRCCT